MNRISASGCSVVLATLVAACGGANGGPGVPTGATAARGSLAANGPLAFSRCMRSHGVSRFPDPGGDGGIPKKTPQQLGVSTSQDRAAQQACAPLLPNSAGAHGLSPTQVQQLATGMR